MHTATAHLLLTHGQHFRSRIDLSSIEDRLKRIKEGSTDREDRRQAILFATYHLLFSGAVAEGSIAECLSVTWTPGVSPFKFPEPVESRADTEDRWANILAWRGTAFDESHNIIGALAFSVVVLFFFESFCKAVIGEAQLQQDLFAGPERPRIWKAIRDRICKGRPRQSRRQMIGMDAVLRWLGSDGKVNESRRQTALFLNRYRNGWHNFGHYNGKPMDCKGVRLKKGKPLPVIPIDKRDEMLGELLALFLEVDDCYRK